MTDVVRPEFGRVRTDGAPEPRRGVGQGFLGRWWFAICTLTLIVASDYKLRVRPPTESLGGSIDSLIILELGLYACVGLYLALNRAQPPRIRRTSLNLYLVCMFVGLMVVSVVYTAYPQYALVRAMQMCILLSLVLVAAREGTRADLHRFVRADLGAADGRPPGGEPGRDG